MIKSKEFDLKMGLHKLSKFFNLEFNVKNNKIHI